MLSLATNGLSNSTDNVNHEKLNYVEFAAHDLKATCGFFHAAFAWDFTWYGEDYASFSNQGLDGGFYKADMNTRVEDGAALLVLYSRDLESTMQKVTAAGGKVCKDIFDFPGGRRFHFKEPSGNELAVWSEQNPKL
ncbi:MAG: putative enzyme related to lactoylglutathione lyase [Glaciecola sp.]